MLTLSEIKILLSRIIIINSPSSRLRPISLSHILSMAEVIGNVIQHVETSEVFVIHVIVRSVRVLANSSSVTFNLSAQEVFDLIFI